MVITQILRRVCEEIQGEKKEGHSLKAEGKLNTEGPVGQEERDTGG